MNTFFSIVIIGGIIFFLGYEIKGLIKDIKKRKESKNNGKDEKQD